MKKKLIILFFAVVLAKYGLNFAMEPKKKCFPAVDNAMPTDGEQLYSKRKKGIFLSGNGSDFSKTIEPMPLLPMVATIFP